MEIGNKKTIRALLKLAVEKGYKIYDRPNELNIWNVRKNTTVPNQFDDMMYVFWKNDSGKWVGKQYPITTDPGTYWLNKPMNAKGTAILKEGQYIDAYQQGMHRSKYKALVQRKPVTVIRDYDRNAVLDFYNGKEDTGLHGINIHRANSTGTTKSINKYSAGCQVFANADDFAEFLKLTDSHKAIYGNQFTLSLVDERAYLRKLKRYGVYLLSGLIIAGAVWTGYRAYKNKPIIPKI
jgi:hypothetical protein